MLFTPAASRVFRHCRSTDRRPAVSSDTVSPAARPVAIRHKPFDSTSGTRCSDVVAPPSGRRRRLLSQRGADQLTNRRNDLVAVVDPDVGTAGNTVTVTVVGQISGLPLRIAWRPPATTMGTSGA